ncbi:aspartyl protease family protein [Sphingomonas sp.]|uniref:aspartyl protease family protein n=1 Tax=Sphingomonas sp. TaxID=28214 RepID=UPI002DD68C63|nr:aspartyl protease family protein [Sphingomonas sp.]
MIDRRALIGAAGAVALLPRDAGAQGRVLVNSITLDGDRAWIAARIGKGEPRLFVIDTGANVSLINNDLARQLQLKEIARSNLRGVGGVSEFPYYDGGELTFASGLRIPAMLFAGTQARLGTDAVGALSAGLFTTYDSDLDFAKGEWRAYPDGRPDFAGLRQLKSRFSGDPVRGDRILADATIGGFSGEFLVDTGAPGHIMLEGRASARSGLWSADRPYVPSEARGIGRGAVPRRIVRVDTLKLGPMTLHRPLVGLSAPGTPSHDGDGFLGLRVLERLHLTTQVKSRTLWIAPNGRAARPDRYPMSGLWLDRKGDAITIADVGTGSPAAAAGLKIGDRVTGAGWDDLTRKLGGPAGSEVAFDVGTRRVVLKLADYL